jgi:uncharacterized protein
MAQPKYDAFSQPISATRVEEEQKRFIWRVYRWMTVGLGLTGVVSMAVASSPAIVEVVYTNPFLLYGILILQVVLALAFRGIAARASALTMMLLFLVFSATVGVTFSFIFLVYTAASIANVFFVTTGTFAAMSAYGYVTKRDLTSVGSFATMGFLGLIVASIVNIFLGSSALDFIVSCVGVVVFVGLTAYNTQRIKDLNVIGNEGTEEDTKEALHGALVLYLDFINLFLYMLRLLGRRR